MILRLAKFFEFGFVRKFGMFLVYWILLISLGYSNFNPIYILYFMFFYLIYSTVYISNDIIDYEFDKKREFSHESKVLSSGLMNIKEYSILGFILLSTGVLLSSIFLSNKFVAISVLLVLFGICRSYISNLILRSFTLFIMEYLNFLAFHLILSQDTFLFFESLKIQIIAVGVSLYYTFLYYFYRRLEKSKDSKEEAKIIVAGTFLILLLFLLLPGYSLFFKLIISIGLILYGIGWAMSVLNKTTKYVNASGYAFFVVSMLYLLWMF